MPLRPWSFVALTLLLSLGRASAQSTGRAAPAAREGESSTTPRATGASGAADDELGDSELARSGLLSDEQTLYEERYGYGERPNRNSAHENENQSYWSFGASYRHSFVPRAMIELFVDQAPRGIDFPQLSLEIGRRRNGVDLIMAVYYTDFSFEGPFRGSGKPIGETSILESDLRSFGASVSMLWSSDFSDVVALQYGFDLGVGAMFGHVVRTEAYPSTGGPHTSDGWAPCVGPTAAGTPGSAQSGDPFDATRNPTASTIDAYCGTPTDTNPAGGYTDPDGVDGEHYGVRSRTLLDGGNVPFFSWRLAPRLSLRIKPIRQIILRLDAGFDFGSGVFLGAGLHYGF